MASFTINFIDAPKVAPTVTADYYQIEDGWVHFKDNGGGQIASFPAAGVVGIRRQSEEAKAIHYGVVGSVDTEALKRAIKQQVDGTGVYA